MENEIERERKIEREEQTIGKWRKKREVNKRTEVKEERNKDEQKRNRKSIEGDEIGMKKKNLARRKEKKHGGRGQMSDMRRS